MRYYEVTAKCGHVGKGFYIPITFPVRAKSAAEAASVTRAFPRVKHDHKDAILIVRSRKMHWLLKILLVAVVWGLYFIIAMASSKGS